MPGTTAEPTTFLPLVRTTAERLAAARLFAAATDAEHTAGALWLGMLAGCAPAGRLAETLAELEAAVEHLRIPPGYLLRAQQVRGGIERAAAEDDGVAFAQAFARLDECLATALLAKGTMGPR